MLEIDRINVYYGDVHVLWNVSLQISSNEIVAVIGPNGAGKSTLLKAIVKILPLAREEKERGRILFQGRELDNLASEDIVTRGITLSPEGARVFPEMTVLDNLKMGAFIRSARGKGHETLQEVFDLFPRLRERIQQRAKTLSGGERQMLAIGRALMSRPKLLLLDEPSLGLEPLLVSKIFKLVTEINRRGVAVLLVEQNVQLALEISHRAYILENGSIVYEGKADEILGSEHVKKSYLAM